jgi:phosphoribosylformylglycinamidine cyclo-ligase
MESKSKYELRGVSATKSEVHQAIKHLDKGLYEHSFCKVLPDIVGGSEKHCNIMHADTAGTKTSLAYLYWKETGNLEVWKGIAQDAMVMNIDDMACVGCTDNIVLSSTIGRNKNLITGDVIKTIIEGTTEFIELMRSHGINIHLAGGETADVGDIVRTIDVGYTTFARMKREDVIVNNVRPGDVIIGLASFGQTIYEQKYNGGMGSNGLTSARHDTLEKHYLNAYPESFDPASPADLIYSGKHRLTDQVEVDGQTQSIGELILSPTRTYLPVLHKMISQVSRAAIHGIIHCTGGAQTKVLKFVKGVHIIKDHLFDPPPLFRIIQESSATDWKEMFQVFNMGHRMELYVDDEVSKLILDICQSFELDAKVIGRVKESSNTMLTIDSAFGSFQYREGEY